MKTGIQPTRYHIEILVQSEWTRTKHSFDDHEEAQAFFTKMLIEDPTWWLRLVSETVLETVTP
jgi:hypothetical protein